MDVKRLQQCLADAGFYHQAIDGGLGRGTYAALFSYMARLDLGAKGLAIGTGCAANLPGAGIKTELRLAHFLAQTATETGGYKTLEENLAYSAAGLMATFPKYFPTEKSTVGFVMNPQPVALKVYSDRLGNGPASTGDGWDYRGRGLLQLTGRANYEARGEEANVPLESMPELAADPTLSVKLACLFWKSRNINAAADADDLVKVRKLVNGGTTGLDDAKIHLVRAKKILLP
ncbi:MAG: glycoside hydrolase family 19 protein [Sphingomonas bacterium]